MTTRRTFRRRLCHPPSSPFGLQRRKLLPGLNFQIGSWHGPLPTNEDISRHAYQVPRSDYCRRGAVTVPRATRSSRRVAPGRLSPTAPSFRGKPAPCGALTAGRAGGARPFGGSHRCASGPVIVDPTPPSRPRLPTQASPASAGRRAPGAPDCPPAAPPPPTGTPEYYSRPLATYRRPSPHRCGGGWCRGPAHAWSRAARRRRVQSWTPGESEPPLFCVPKERYRCGGIFGRGKFTHTAGRPAGRALCPAPPAAQSAPLLHCFFTLLSAPNQRTRRPIVLARYFGSCSSAWPRRRRRPVHGGFAVGLASSLKLVL